MDEIYIDNLEAITIEQTMTGVRLTIGHNTYTMPTAIARQISLEIMSKCFVVHQAAVEAMTSKQALELAGHKKDSARVQVSLL